MEGAEMRKLASILVDCSDGHVGGELIEEMLNVWPEMLPYIEAEWARPYDDGSGSNAGIYGGKTWAQVHNYDAAKGET